MAVGSDDGACACWLWKDIRQTEVTVAHLEAERTFSAWSPPDAMRPLPKAVIMPHIL